METAATPITLAEPLQVAEITRLLALVNIPEKEVEAMLSRAKAETIADLSQPQAAAMIAWLRKKVMPE